MVIAFDESDEIIAIGIRQFYLKLIDRTAPPRARSPNYPSERTPQK